MWILGAYGGVKPTEYIGSSLLGSSWAVSLYRSGPDACPLSLIKVFISSIIFAICALDFWLSFSNCSIQALLSSTMVLARALVLKRYGAGRAVLLFRKFQY